MKIVLVHLYNHQTYIHDNIENLKRFHNHDITVITDTKFIPLFPNVQTIPVESLIHGYAQYIENIKKSFRGGFVQLTSFRFHALLQYMKKHNVENIIHLENDVMVFQNMDTIPFHNTSKILLTMDEPTRCIPGLMFIPKHNTLETCMACFHNHNNDMQNWGISYFQNKEYIDLLPIFETNEHFFTQTFNHYNLIFDAAAIGQYLGGVDPRNIPGDTKGFVNQECLIDYSKYQFVWLPNTENIQTPFIVIDNKYIPVVNLHVHSKNLKQFIK